MNENVITIFFREYFAVCKIFIAIPDWMKYVLLYVGWLVGFACRTRLRSASEVVSGKL
jgi:hypothetical protein